MAASRREELVFIFRVIDPVQKTEYTTDKLGDNKVKLGLLDELANVKGLRPGWLEISRKKKLLFLVENIVLAPRKSLGRV